jgi:long-chain acyl-CoA synthetase
MNIVRGLLEAGKKRGAEPAILFEGTAIPYDELVRRVATAAGGLARAGIVRGDRVGLFLPNIPELVAVYYALMHVGAIAVSINVMSKPEELRHILNDSTAAALVTTAELLVNVPRRSEIPTVRTVFVDGPAPDAMPLSALTEGEPHEESPIALEPDAPAAILYTSGTTGRSKGAVLSHGNVVSNVEATRSVVGMQPSDKMICFLPLFHCFGQNFIMNATLYTGATLVLLRRFAPEGVLAACETHEVTMFFGVPTAYIALLAHGRSAHALRTVRYFFSAAAILPTHIETAWHALTGKHIHEGYGLTETSPFAAYNHARAYKPGSIGAPIDGVQMQIVDEQRRPLSDNQAGEICIRGPNVMLGYFQRDTETKHAIVDGWFYTGDIGLRDSEGDYFIVDRVKDMVNVGGFKVWPREVEEVLFTHPSVHESAVIGVPDDYSGEAVKAFIVLKSGCTLTADEVMAHCRAHLSNYKVPKYVEVIEALPKGATGKILKKELRVRA